MNNKSILSILIILSALLTFGGEITKTYYFSDYSVIQADQYQLMQFESCLNTGYTGAPSMPWFAVKLLLPPGEKAVSFTVNGSREEHIHGVYKLYPQQASRPLSQESSENFSYDRNVYASTDPYPEKPHGMISTEYMNGHGIAILNICPLRYIPATGQLSFYNEITVSVRTEAAGEPQKAMALLNNNNGLSARLNHFIQNLEMIASYPARSSRTDDYQLLIITPQAFENEFDNLTNLYLYRGIKSEITTIEEIASTMTGVDLQEKIRNYIIQEVQNHGVGFVLLGGDVEHVPYRGFYCYVQSGSGYSDDDIPADLYYCALDGTWNDNGNNLWGEIGEDDLLPDVALGRFSFSNLTELNAMLNKTISYQDNPITGELTHPLLAGEHLWGNPETWGSDYLRLLVGYHDDNGYTTIGIPPGQNIDSLYERYQNWGGSDIMAAINQGKSFIHHSGHSNASTVMHLSIPDITNANFSQVNGITHNFTYVFSHGCICGAFDESDCIMEHMVKIENFAAAVIGNSRYGWFNEGQTEGPAAHLNREMVDALYEEELGRIGAAFVECKIQTAPWVNAPGQHEEGALRWNFYDINILGDPTLQVWTDEPFTPTALYTSPLQLGDTVVNVSVYNNGVLTEGMVCVLIKDGVIHGLDTTNASGQASIIIDPPITSTGTAELVISGYNCLTTSFNVLITTAAGPFIVYQDHILNDTVGGNANGKADFGESIQLTVALANAGAADATNVEAILGTSDDYVDINDNFGDYGTIGAGTISAPLNEFAFVVDDSIPDQHIVEFNLDISDDSKQSWSASFNVTLNAPVLEAGTMSIDDGSTGNGNSFLDPGETATLSFGVLNNGHSTAPETEAFLSTESPWITINSNTAVVGDLEPGAIAYAGFGISVHEDTPLGTLVEFTYTATSGAYAVVENYSSTVGLMVEDWETGDFENFNWQFAGNMPWVIDNANPYEGSYCSKSGDISDGQKSELYLTIEVLADGDLSFYRKVSSEAEWDFLRFYIDNDMAGEWSGVLDWEMVSFPVSQGIHTFSWVYEKDAYLSGGEDCAWVDYIVFPPVDVTTGISKPEQIKDMAFRLWPNPATEQLNISFVIPENGRVNIVLTDLMGHEVLQMFNSIHMPAGKHQVQQSISGLSPGIYFCRLISSTGSISRKIVIQ
ncbi:MAG: C25 family cysteine peptidase [Bacteroidales bacterium]|nr:C25 family cysteine peptidase [Bacteroidales bacterium]